MTLKDTFHGSVWMSWIIFFVLVYFGIRILQGKTKYFRKGFNNMPKKRYVMYKDEVISKITGIGTLIIAGIVLVINLFSRFIPAYLGWIFAAVAIADAVIMIVLANTIGRMKREEQ